jgi:1-deoxy-D-xylulose-5-phosphate synthase
MNEEEMRNLMYTAQLRNLGPFSIRYPKGRGVMQHWRKSFKEIPIGKGRIVREGTDLAILSIGHIGNLVAEACEILKEEYSMAHFDMRFVKPLDQELLHKVFGTFNRVITVEDGTIVGGFGSAVLEFMSENHYSAQVRRLGIPDRFIEHGTQEQLYSECGFDVNGICRTVREMVKPKLLTKVI